MGVIMSEGGEGKWDGGLLWRLHGMTFDARSYDDISVPRYRIRSSIDR